MEKAKILTESLRPIDLYVLENNYIGSIANYMHKKQLATLHMHAAHACSCYNTA